MASSPNSQPGGPPAPPSPLISSLAPLASPLIPNVSAPPPATPSPPPPAATPPSPSATKPPVGPPPSPPHSPPPPARSPPSPPPQSPPKASPPPQSSPSPPPPVSQGSPPPESTPPPPSPSVFQPPPPIGSPPAPPPVNVDSPPAPPISPTTSVPSPPDNTSSPPVPSTSAPSPPGNSPAQSGSTPRPSRSETPGKSNVTVNSVAQSPNGPDRDQAVRMGIAVGVVAAVVIIAFMLVIMFVQRRKRRHDRYNSVYMLPSPFNSSPDSSYMKQNSSGGSVEVLHSAQDTSGLSNSKTWFTYEELTTATNSFASQNILGAGGFGCVYKGCLQDGRVVAIKKLKDNSGQGDREFKAEVEIISRVHHRHLVTLVGYCITDYQRLLVYEFVPNNTLHYHLHASNKPVMAWPLRVKVACGSARGLAYLHEDCHPRIIHRDIKSANILIENNFEAKVADFGLAKLAQELESNTHISTRVMGTFGYMAPEYASSGKLTEKSDVFSFGVVLLELITGRKPVDESRPLGDESLVEWARPIMTEALDNQNFDELADPRLQGNYDRGEMFRMIEAAAACVRHSATKRPKMSQVVRALDTMNELSDLSNGMRPGQSGIYDSREQSAQIRMFQRMAFGSQEFSSDHNNSQASWMSGGRSGQV